MPVVEARVESLSIRKQRNPSQYSGPFIPHRRKCLPLKGSAIAVAFPTEKYTTRFVHWPATKFRQSLKSWSSEHSVFCTFRCEEQETLHGIRRQYSKKLTIPNHVKDSQLHHCLSVMDPE
ncbi:hypothetical protein M758_12G003500 [Ceratodon purpureus]|uniref:Uncharacterized protein n=1 Tax=Ceratodon purpureus TaxID=3225 RepID=A0A8T0G4E2_CERPU|nr:hypothetical protein KC19_12G002000 [Ceratodon purpureus]KAG0597550.1 hypothetical protein M758_12G003500 [Ceratodon purpureus]